MNTGALIETEELARLLEKPDVRLIDATWHMPPIARDAAFLDFQARHIPGAVFFDIDAVADTASPLPHMLPAAEFFEKTVGGLGIGNADTVVVYDAHGLMSAPRVWWMFRFFGHERVRVLNGGLPKWEREGRPLASGLPTPRPAVFAATPNPSLLTDWQAIQTHLAQAGLAKLPQTASEQESPSQVLDLRSVGRFYGRDPEPRAGLRRGHIPGSRNIPWTDLLHPDEKTLLPPEILKARFEEAGLDIRKSVACSCGSGITACVGLLALFILGNDKASVYDGSWAEWGGRTDLPVT